MRAVLIGPVFSSHSYLKRLVKGLHINLRYGSRHGQKRGQKRGQEHGRNKDLLVGVDGGTELCYRMGLKPDFAVGDWDSLKKKQLLSRLPHLDLPRDKDRSDLFFAVLAALYAGADELVCLGVAGGRPDHQMAMILDLASFANAVRGIKKIEVFGEEGEYRFLSSRIPKWTGQGLKGRTISLFALGRAVTGLTLKGFRYSLKNGVILPSSHGLSNVVINNKCEVSLRNGSLLVIMPRYG